MSIRHLLAAAELQHLYPETDTHLPVKLSPSHKWALAAIADDASDKTDRSYPGLEKVQRWAGVGKRRALELIADLTEAGLLESISAGHPGKRAVYQVHIPKPAPEPVDNSRIMGAESRTPQIMGALKDENARDIAPLSLDPLLKISKSVNDVTTEAVDNSADAETTGNSSSWAAWRLRRAIRKAGKTLGVDILADAAGTLFADFDRPRHILLLTAYGILGKALKAGTVVHNPTAYVAASLRAEPEVHRQAAFNLDGPQ